MTCLPPGDHLLRLEVLSPANFGSTGGGALVDRPVAVDAFDALPYLPSSALKGVLAGRHGNAGGGGGTRRRLFGSPDVDEDGSGEAGALVIGDGEPLCFPVPLRSGGTATVLIARCLFQLRSLGVLRFPELQRIDQDDAYQGDVAADELPVRARWTDFGIAPAALTALASTNALAPVIVAAPAVAAELWRAAVEDRTLTRIGDDGLVLPGSLRTIELVPSGTVFLSLLSNTLDEEIQLDEGPWQIGAWEATGCGYVATSIWQQPRFESGGGSPSPPASRRRAQGQDTMVRSFEALDAIAATPVAAIARSAIFDLGPRLRVRGLPATLAFALAKATGDAEAPGRRGRERTAYRWLLRSLLQMEPQAGEMAIHRRTVAAITGDEPAPAEMETAWLWLRRFAETKLKAEASDA